MKKLFWWPDARVVKAGGRYFCYGIVAYYIGLIFVEPLSINGASMAPALSPDYSETNRKRDLVLWKRWNATKNLQRGDVIFFSNPLKPEETATKRIVALSGDTVLLDPKRRPQDVRNGRANRDASTWDMWRGRVLVPEGHVWVEGDNRGKTIDSNDYGPVSKSLVQGKAHMILRPLGQFGTRPWEGYKVKTRVIEGKDPKSNREEMQVWWEPH